jgi:probable HAF family extracellular repeat protein
MTRHSSPCPASIAKNLGSFIRLFAIASLLHPSGSTEGAAIFTPLGLFSSTRSEGHDVSADGLTVVGTVYQPATDTFKFFRWTAQGSVLGPTSTNFAAVSADGRVVVGATPLSPRPRAGAVRWITDGSAQSIGFLSGDDSSAGTDVSADGMVVVGSSATLVSNPEGFRWTQADGMVGLGSLPDGPIYSIANGVSADGTIVVGLARTTAPGSVTEDAFRWTAETGMVPLPRTLNGIGGTRAQRISADGSAIVGTVSFPAAPGLRFPETQAFIWREDGDNLALGDLPGGRLLSSASDVSADGSVIVGVGETFYQDGVGAINEAFYWTATTGMLNLRDVLISGGATGLEGWTLTEANGVSYDGLTVVGTGIHNGVTEAWVATIPEPSTLGLAVVAGLGFLAICCRRKSLQTGR